jgi:alkanesulfonate monooxygenase SsuD/methylene tetrahydromethanopterin reductase-like flavin-dependent oxidoreductase (luciferase family)
VTLRIFVEPQQGATYDQLLAAATTAEECGFGAFFRSDHILKMGNPPGPPTVTDAWVTIAGLARDTTTIRLGTLVTPVSFRPIGGFAVTIAQTDHMSGGRIEVGLGAGWYQQEHDAFGLPFPDLRDRMDLLDDQLSILHGLWSTPPGGTFAMTGATGSVSIDADSVRPRQQPGPPLVMGGAARPRSALLATAYASEYNAGFQSAATTREIHDRVRATCERSGRDPASLVYSAALVACCGVDDAEFRRRAAITERDPDDLRRDGLGGTPDEIIAKLHRYADAGVERFYLQVLDVTDLDQLHLIAEAVMTEAPGR